ncbi:hypothetical protein B0H16DRAFT_1896727 [Mycena metata]|uniref:Uncharacterized protein n=1 Tax=Mycena metata TaxID=1033252 RepID=A0AAD7MJS1_9AGAR|nr:hypothetical protein B0H16DRAFT_1896727 [Mycena metata]
MPGAKLALAEASTRPMERSDFVDSASPKDRRRISSKWRWRKAEIAGYEDVSSTVSSESPVFATVSWSSTAAETLPITSSLPSSGSSATLNPLPSPPTAYGANIPVSFSLPTPGSVETSASSSSTLWAVAGPVAPVPSSGVSSPASNSANALPSTPTYGANIPATPSLPTSGSAGTSTSSSTTLWVGGGPIAPFSSSGADTTTSSSGSTTLFAPGFSTTLPSGASTQSAGAALSLSNTGSSGSASVNFSGSVSNTAPTPPSSGSAPIPSGAPVSGAGGRSIANQEPSNTLSFTAFLPTSDTTTTGASQATHVSSTSGSRTFHNPGAIVGVAVAATFALVLGVLFMLFLCRRFKGIKPKRKFSGTWISPPLMQGDDGVADAYSPVARRSRRGSSAFLRPLSFQSSETPAANANMPTDDLDSHDDLDSWAAAFPSPPSFPAASHASSPILPDFPPPSAESEETFLAEESRSPISAKGFMRRLRRGRPSMASRGLLTTLPPVPESPNSPGPSMAEISRPPSSLHAPNNYSLPWIHRTGGRAIPPTTSTAGS